MLERVKLQRFLFFNEELHLNFHRAVWFCMILLVWNNFTNVFISFFVYFFIFSVTILISCSVSWEYFCYLYLVYFICLTTIQSYAQKYLEPNIKVINLWPEIYNIFVVCIFPDHLDFALSWMISLCFVFFCGVRCNEMKICLICLFERRSGNESFVFCFPVWFISILNYWLVSYLWLFLHLFAV